MTENNNRLISATMMNHLAWIIARAIRQNRFSTLDTVVSMMDRGATCKEITDYISEMEEYDRKNEMSMFHSSWDEDSKDENSEDEDSEDEDSK